MMRVDLQLMLTCERVHHVTPRVVGFEQELNPIQMGATFTIAPLAKMPTPEVEVRNWKPRDCGPSD